MEATVHSMLYTQQPLGVPVQVALLQDPGLHQARHEAYLMRLVLEPQELGAAAGEHAHEDHDGAAHDDGDGDRDEEDDQEDQVEKDPVK